MKYFQSRDDQDPAQRRAERPGAVNIACAMTLVATTFALTTFAQEPKRPDKAQSIQAIEQSIGGKFVQERLSNDKRSVQWEFLAGACHGFPVIVDLTSYSSLEQANRSIWESPVRWEDIEQYKEDSEPRLDRPECWIAPVVQEHRWSILPRYNNPA